VLLLILELCSTKDTGEKHQWFAPNTGGQCLD